MAAVLGDAEMYTFTGGEPPDIATLREQWFNWVVRRVDDDRVVGLVQATVLAPTARVAEALAKVAVIAGSGRAFDLLDRPDVDGLLLLTDRGEVLASRSMVRWLA